MGWMWKKLLWIQWWRILSQLTMSRGSVNSILPEFMREAVRAWDWEQCDQWLWTLCGSDRGITSGRLWVTMTMVGREKGSPFCKLTITWITLLWFIKFCSLFGKVWWNLDWYIFLLDQSFLSIFGYFGLCYKRWKINWVAI